ncbi:uncharacterized protein LOC135219179 isoform X1 [Macrobrachium nipponense]|uniref:uncharacterized protein LOC135219179 isoform X1 n=1 Tax=Macrobrachium nipponense TaxID=159736 RepID=UPI0030C814B6
MEFGLDASTLQLCAQARGRVSGCPTHLTVSSYRDLLHQLPHSAQPDQARGAALYVTAVVVFYVGPPAGVSGRRPAQESRPERTPVPQADATSSPTPPPPGRPHQPSLTTTRSQTPRQPRCSQVSTPGDLDKEDLLKPTLNGLFLPDVSFTKPTLYIWNNTVLTYLSFSSFCRSF